MYSCCKWTTYIWNENERLIFYIRFKLLNFERIWRSLLVAFHKYVNMDEHPGFIIGFTWISCRFLYNIFWEISLAVWKNILNLKKIQSFLWQSWKRTLEHLIHHWKGPLIDLLFMTVLVMCGTYCEKSEQKPCCSWLVL